MSSRRYCTLCDKMFPSNEHRREHIQRSTKHPECRDCARRFLNLNSLRGHYVFSYKHHFCSVCEKSFRTAAGLRMHIEYDTAHQDPDADYEDDLCEFDQEAGWEDREGAELYPEDNVRHARLISNRIASRLEQSWQTAYEKLDVEDDEESEPNKGVDANDDEGYESGNKGDVQSTSTSSSSSSPSTRTRRTPSPSRPPKQDQQPEFTCSICFSVPKIIASTHCGHIFCARCISTVFTDDDPARRRCPVCRVWGCIDDLRKIHL